MLRNPIYHLSNSTFPGEMRNFLPVFFLFNNKNEWKRRIFFYLSTTRKFFFWGFYDSFVHWDFSPAHFSSAAKYCMNKWTRWVNKHTSTYWKLYPELLHEINIKGRWSFRCCRFFITFANYSTEASAQQYILNVD